MVVVFNFDPASVIQRVDNFIQRINLYSQKNWIVWFQKISIPPPRRELEIPEGWGVKGPGNSGEEGGLLVNSRFQMVKFHAMQICLKIVSYLL